MPTRDLNLMKLQLITLTQSDAILRCTFYFGFLKIET